MVAEYLTPQSIFRHRRLWLILGWALVFWVIWLSLTPAPVQVSLAGGDKLGHLLAYGALMVWFSSLYEDSIARVMLAIGFAAMGIALEFVQGWTGYRTFEIADMVANASGVFAGWVVAPPRLPNFLRRIEALSPVRKQD
jgi:VanZ family protein